MVIIISTRALIRQPRPCPALFVVRFGVRFRFGGERDLDLDGLRVLVHGLVDDLLDVLDERTRFLRVPLDQRDHVERPRLKFRFQAGGQSHGTGGKLLIDVIPRDVLALLDPIFGMKGSSPMTHFTTTSRFEHKIIVENFGYEDGDAPILGFTRWDKYAKYLLIFMRNQQ